MIVEVDTRSAPATGECYRADLEAGGSARCTFTNIVFFTGIPTLNPCGMVLMMLGVATVGFRRIF